MMQLQIYKTTRTFIVYFPSFILKASGEKKPQMTQVWGQKERLCFKSLDMIQIRLLCLYQHSTAWQTCESSVRMPGFSLRTETTINNFLNSDDTIRRKPDNTTTNIIPICNAVLRFSGRWDANKDGDFMMGNTVGEFSSPVCKVKQTAMNRGFPWFMETKRSTVTQESPSYLICNNTYLILDLYYAKVNAKLGKWKNKICRYHLTDLYSASSQ